jgi:hypothetical protein
MVAKATAYLDQRLNSMIVTMAENMQAFAMATQQTPANSLYTARPMKVSSTLSAENRVSPAQTANKHTFSQHPPLLSCVPAPFSPAPITYTPPHVLHASSPPTPILANLDPPSDLQSRGASQHIFFHLVVLFLTILSFRFSRPWLRDKKPGIILQYSQKDCRTQPAYQRKSLQYAIITCILALLIPQASATAINSNGISIWTLNMAGTGTTLKMNSVHDHVMNGNPDIFVLTDTRSDGSTLKSQWDWKDYQVREQKGYSRLRNGRIVIGVKRHLPIIQEHTDVPGIDGQLLHITIKTVIRGKWTRIKVMGIYAPPCASESAAATDFFQAIRSWMDTFPTKDGEWIMAGDLNLSLSWTEASDQTYYNHRLARTEYWKVLSLPKSPGFDWWTKRERNRSDDFTRRRWGQADNSLSGKSISTVLQAHSCLNRQKSGRDEICSLEILIMSGSTHPQRFEASPDRKNILRLLSNG